MSKKTSYLLGVLLTIILGTILYYFLCCKCCYSVADKAEEVETIVAEPEPVMPTKSAFSVIDSKSGIAFNANDNFNFKTSDFSILQPLSENLNTEISKLSTFLNDNPSKSVDITGYYKNEEENTTAFPNLGLARANSVKNYFVSQGISSKAINTSGELKDDLVADDTNTFYGPLTYGIGTIDKNDTSTAETLKLLGEEIKADPLVLYFDIGNTTIELTETQRQKMAKISRYVDKVDNASIQIIGHTDNTGDRASNVQLGQNRADFAKEYLVKNAISESKIKTASKGPDQPIADNADEVGRAKNRRVVVTIN